MQTMIDPFEHFIYKVSNAPVRTYPFPHMVVPEVIQKQEYQRLMLDVPRRFGHRRDEVYGTAVAEELEPIWQRWIEFLESDQVAQLFMDKFGIEGGYTTRFRFHRDQVGFEISPHPDVSSKMVSIMIYFPKGESCPTWGTHICVPKEEGVEFNKGHHSWDDFKVVETVPFVPSMLFAFPPGENTFHAVKVDPDYSAERLALKGFVFRETDGKEQLLL